jgi:hypothetical protein
MEKRGIFFWLKPLLYPSMPINSKVHEIIMIFMCLAYKRSYNCCEIIVAPCKHLYHPFYLANLLKKTTNVVFVGQNTLIKTKKGVRNP